MGEIVGCMPYSLLLLFAGIFFGLGWAFHWGFYAIDNVGKKIDEEQLSMLEEELKNIKAGNMALATENHSLKTQLSKTKGGDMSVKATHTLIFQKDKKKQWYWRFIASNGKIIDGSTESYSSKSKAKKSLISLLEAIRWHTLNEEALHDKAKVV